jgi:hypothetical protein
MWWARGFPVLLITENCCYVDWYGLELRFKKNIDDAWDFDEIVGPCFLHIEQMSDWSYWLGISTETSGKDELYVNNRLCQWPSRGEDDGRYASPSITPTSE